MPNKRNPIHLSHKSPTMDDCLRGQIRDLIRREVVVATGCPEPGAVALAVAKARETLGAMPDSTELLLSKNVFKNAMGVGIPGTGMIGLPIAVAIALTSGESQRQLEVLTVPAEAVDKAKGWLANNGDRISIGLKEPCEDKLYIECICTKGSDKATAIISKRHTNFVYVAKNDNVLVDNEGSQCGGDSDCGNEPRLSQRIVYDYATTVPLDELKFIMETVSLNSAAANEGLKGYGLNTGRILMENADGDIVHTVIARTVAASDARGRLHTAGLFQQWQRQSGHSLHTAGIRIWQGQGIER